MSELNKGRYSLEDALNEKEKIREKVGKENASAYEYNKAETQIEIEKRATAEVSGLYELKEIVGDAYSKAQAIDEEVKKRAEPLIREIYEKLGKELKQEEAWINYEKISRETGSKFREIISAWIKEVYEGKYGRGELAINLRMEETPQLIRVIAIQKSKSGGAAKVIAKLIKEGVAQNVLRPSKDANLFEQKTNQKNGANPDVTFANVEDSFKRFDFVEVDFSGTTEQELDAFYKKLKEKKWTLSRILEAFPKNYKPKVQIGEIFNFGHMDHHSGIIEGKQVILPTGRLAVVSKYEGEYEDLYGDYRFWGVLTDPKTEPHWSAKRGAWEGPPLDAPNEEEINFLKSMDVKFANDTNEKILENREQKMLEDSSIEEKTKNEI